MAAYADSVLRGDVPAGKLVRLACERHKRDLIDGPARGLTWDAETLQRVLAFFSYLRLPMAGETDGKAFVLEPFEVFIIGSLFAWKQCDGFRRYRTAFVEIGKGNGKTPLAAGIGLYGLVADGEASAEIYPAATTREQAGIMFRDAKLMAEASPALRSALSIGLHNLAFPKTDSFLRPVSGEHRALDGKRVHMALLDEIHEHPTSMVVDKMRAGTKNRRQALIFEITNSGFDRNSVAWAHHEYSAQILSGVITNDSWFAYICQLDACAKCVAEGQEQPVDGCPTCDDWRDEKTWIKANPGLNTILPARYLREQVEEAKGMPSKEGIVRRLNFCQWTSAVTKAIRMDRWDACKTSIDMDALAGQQCYLGIDLGATSDFTAAVLLFPQDDEEAVELPPTEGASVPVQIFRRSYKMLTFFWLPESPPRRTEQMQMTIREWRRQGALKTTPGDVVDYDEVLNDVVKLGERYEIQEVGFDRGFQGVQFGTDLISHFGERRLYTVPQGILSMNAPFRELKELIVDCRIAHDGNPVMRWMCDNCAEETRGGLTKPSKDKSTEKIDGVTAATMALARAMLRPKNVVPSVGWL